MGFIVIGVVVGASALLLGGFYLKMKSELSGFTPMETGNIGDDVLAIKDDYTNFFMVRNGAKYIAIDSGINQAAAAAQMKALNINPDDVSAVFLTHTDSDHVGALGLFGKAEWYLSKEEEPMINGKKSRFLFFSNSIPRTDYRLLEDRQTVQIGNLKIEGILAPGHTSGTMAYLVNDRYLFTGDILSLHGGKITPFPAFFNMDTDQAIRSMERVRHLPTAEYLFTAHWGYTGDYKTAVE